VLRDNLKFQEALVEFERAADIDPTNLAARQEAQKTADMIKTQAQQKEGAEGAKPMSTLAKMAEDMQGPVDLEPFPTLRSRCA